MRKVWRIYGAFFHRGSLRVAENLGSPVRTCQLEDAMDALFGEGRELPFSR